MDADYQAQTNCWTPASNRDLGFQLPMLVNVTEFEAKTPLFYKSRLVDGYSSTSKIPVAGYIPSYQPEPRKTSAVNPLSKREKEILQLAASGCSNKEIAHKCCLSQATVKTHLHNIFSKIDVNNRTAAVVQATAEGLLDVDLIRNHFPG